MVKKLRKHPITLYVYWEVPLNKVIKAVEDLLSYYKNPRATRFNDGNCPLCDLFDCDYCLWVIFHHMTCDDFAGKRFDTDVGLLKKDEKWRAFRREELVYWLQELKRPGVKVIERD